MAIRIRGPCSRFLFSSKESTRNSTAVATQDDVRRIALSLPEVVEDGTSYAVPNKGKPKRIAWVWRERVHPKKARVPNPAVVGVQVADLDEKEMLLASDDGSKLFTEPHYNGYAAVLIRLEAIEVDELTELLTDAWRCQAPAALVEAFDARL